MPRPQTRAQLEARLADLTSTLQDLQQRWEARERDLVDTVNRRDKSIAAQAQEIDRCRDELHRLELENARLGGVIERVRELDPMSERDHANRNAGMVANELEQAAHRLRYPLSPAPGGGVFTDMAAPYRNGASVETPAPYYRRRY